MEKRKCASMGCERKATIKGSCQPCRETALKYLAARRLNDRWANEELASLGYVVPGDEGEE
jgi:hypothetical protein